MLEESPILLVAIVILLVILEAMVTSAEAAFQMMSEGKIRKKAEQGDKKAGLMLKFIGEESQYISVIEVIITSISLLVGAVFSGELVRYSKYSAVFLHKTEDAKVIRSFFFVLFFLLLLYIVILFGNILPKKLAARNPEKIAYRRINLLMVCRNFLSPFLAVLETSIHFLLFLMRINPKDLEENVTQEEIISMVNEGHEQGVLEASEAEMISNIIEFDEKEVKDIMTHRKKIVAINAELTVEEAIHAMLKERYSRFPLYEEDINNIVGILHLKDVMAYYLSEKDNQEHLKNIAREPYFVPETQNISVLFNDMQLKKIHMAIAVDEYGQTAGVIAMEDILEEIVGNIFDEYDIDERFIVDQGNNRYLMRGMAELEEVAKVLNIEIEEEEYGTLNGLLISVLGRIPSDGEKLAVSYKGYRFYIFDVSHKMIRLVRVTKERQFPKRAVLIEKAHQKEE